MNYKDAVKQNLALANDVVLAYLDDLSDDNLLLRPLPGMNHIAWQLGHLIASEHDMLAAIGVQMPPLPDKFAERHHKDNAESDDWRQFHKKAEYVGLFNHVRNATARALETATDADLEQPSPEAMRSYAPTVGSVYLLLGAHVMMHAGQWVAVRRKLGKPIVI